MAVELITLKLKARQQLRSWYITKQHSNMDHLFLNELRFIMDNQTRSLTRRWFMERFPNMLGYF